MSVVCVASYYDPPSSLIAKNRNPKDLKDLECEKIWFNHQGGFEGFRQKGWTLIAICLLLMIEYETGIKSYIIGQEDNQVCKLMLPKSDNTQTNDLYLNSHQEIISEQINSFFHYLIFNWDTTSG